MSQESIARVRVEPSGVVVDVQRGETLLHAAQRTGQPWPTVCYGEARCTRCCVEVLEGNAHLGPVTDAEAPVLDRLARLRRDLVTRRLACQVVVDGDVAVSHVGVRPVQPDPDVGPARS